MLRKAGRVGRLTTWSRCGDCVKRGWDEGRGEGSHEGTDSGKPKEGHLEAG